MAKTHFRKVFKSDHLGCADIEDYIEQGSDLVFTIKQVRQEYGTKVAGKKIDANIAYFNENIKPLVLNSTNSKALKTITGSSFVEDWANITVQLYIDESASLMGQRVGGVRINPKIIKKKKVIITPDNINLWSRAVSSYRQNKNFDLIEKHAEISKENKQIIIGLCKDK
jgi:hypothetical protein